MSRFFESIDEEKSETKRAVVREKVYDAEEKVSKKEKRLNELQCRVMELEEEENQKLFDKQLKKMFVEIRKAENCFENGVPAFLKRFLTSSRVTKAHRDAVDELLSRHETKSRDVVVETSKKDEERVCRDLDKILVIKNPEQRRRDLVAYKNETDNVLLKTRALMTLLSIHMKSENSISIMKTIDELAGCLDRDASTEGMRQTFLENLDFYLETVYERVDSSNAEMYRALLEKLRPLGECVGRRLLQLSFFKLGLAPETDDVLFRMVWMSRTRPYEETKEYYLQVRNRVGSSRMELEALQEVGLLAFRHGDFETSFEALSACSEKIPEHGVEMRLLCVILNDRIRDNAIYRRFLEDFRDLGRNRFCLPSGNDTFEIYRSFYLLNMYDQAGAGVIIRKYCGDFDESAWLGDFVRARLIKE